MIVVTIPHKTGIMSGKKAHKPGKEEQGLKAWKVLWVFFVAQKRLEKRDKSSEKEKVGERGKRKNVDFIGIIGLF